MRKRKQDLSRDERVRFGAVHDCSGSVGPHPFFAFSRRSESRSMLRNE